MVVVIAMQIVSRGWCDLSDALEVLEIISVFPLRLVGAQHCIGFLFLQYQGS